MALQFPSASVGQTYSSGSSGTYQWNGTKWTIITPPTQVYTRVGATYQNEVMISGSTTAPTKATTRQVDYINVYDDGTGWCQLNMNYTAASSTGAANGSGIYLFNLPSGVTFDTTIHRANTETGTSPTTQAERTKLIPGSFGRMINDSFAQQCQALVHNATQFKLVGLYGEAGAGLSYWYFLQSGYFGITGANTSFNIAFRFKKG